MRQQLSCTILCLLITNTLWAQTPPATWQEHWFEHNQLLNRVFYDNDVAIYYDNDVSRSITWPNSFMGDVWRYTKSVYGNFGSDPHLFAIFHTNKYSGGHPSTYFDASHDNRNVIDVGPGPWTSGTGGDLDITTHEVAHIVEGASKGIHGSPAFGIWGDSKWAEIFIYDVYKSLGKTSEMNRWFNQMQNQTDNFPRTNTHWFRDWFYPIYNSYGGTQVLNRFFTLLAQYFPKNGNNYSRGMNWGEFVHFWSGAAGVNLKSLATTAFGWPAAYETQFNQARIDFPFTYGTAVVTVYKDCNYGGYAVNLNAGSYTLSQLQALGVVNDDISSLKVQSGYRVTLYWDNNFQGSTLVKTADDACLVDDGWNDKVSSLVIAAASPVVQSQSATANQRTDQSVSFNVYPVPAQQQLNINTNEDITGGIISVYDITGKQVIAARTATRRIDVSKLTPGAYMLIYSKNGQMTKKQFIKQ